MDYVILDTSSIIFSLSNKRDILMSIRDRFPNSRILVSDGVLGELKKLSSGRSRYAKYAAVAISLLNRYDNVKVAKNSSYVDKWIIREASKLGAVVCSNDIKLKRALKAAGISTISVSRDGSLR
ncbi:MAG: hypothetical protein KGH50_02235 [Candidatus Micrarchaeota archaeon]|nr:hypothetical protein [Candidatus Micrarchaeota archaeon]